MKEEYMSAKEAAEELGLYLKVVTSMQTFDNYNSFFNIFSQHDEPCRRIVILTPYKDLEEVCDESPGEPIIVNTLVDGNIWIKEYSLLTPSKDISLESMVISKDLVKDLVSSCKCENTLD